MTDKMVEHIIYKKESSGETTERDVIFIEAMQTSRLALDVTDLNDDFRKQLSDLQSEYSKFVKQRMDLIPSFELWLDNSNIEFPTELIRYRKFLTKNF